MLPKRFFLKFLLQYHYNTYNKMGKRAGKFKPQMHGQKKIKNQWSSPTIPQDNPLFRTYYQMQLQLPQEQFQIFWATMKEKLPVVFRINPSCPNYEQFRLKVQDPNFLQSMIEGEGEEKQKGRQEEMKEEKESKHEPKEVPRLEILPWYPGNVLHQINTTKQIFKKSKLLNNLHKYLQKGFDAGLIARQQLVSMLPPLFLDVHPEDIILDMCAAPGSKTSQLLEMLYGNEKTLKKGCVIANDADYSRAQMLIHQINRSGTAGMAVINHPGQFMPQLYTSKQNHVKLKFQFDKILCDVPCSGDGATRKLPIKWAKWHPSDGISLHPLQLSILMKSINLLKKGGLIVYSTCSLNPIQNQAVLSGLLKKVGRGLELLDIHGVYGIKGRRGMHHWDVCGVQIVKNGEQQAKSRNLRCYKSYEEVKENHRIKESMFPPSPEQANKMNLHYSMRILPHDQNSGGFFVALLRKTQEFQWLYDSKQGKLIDEKEEGNEQEQFLRSNMPQVENAVVVEDEGHHGQHEKEEKQMDQEEEENQEKEEKGEKQEKEEHEEHEGEGEMKVEEAPQNNRRRHHQSEEKGKKSKESLKYQPFDNLNQEEFQSIQKFFGLSEELRQLLYVRDLDGTSKRKVLLVSEGVRRFLEADREKKIKLVNMGCKVFEKGKQSFAGYECLYRLSQQGIHFLLPFMQERKVKVTLDFFRSVLSIHSLMHDDIKQQEIREQIRKMSQGSFCVYIDEEINGRRIVDALVGQNFKSSFHLMVGKEEIASLNLRYL